MKKLNGKTDAQKYMLFGELTQPFLPTIELEMQIFKSTNQQLNHGKTFTIIDALLQFIHENVKPTTDIDFKLKNKFNRTAKEIWQSGMATGYTDYALLFCCLARQIRIPTTFLSTVGKTFYTQSRAGQKPQLYVGHQFCECYCSCYNADFNKTWVLIDPTICKITTKYATNKNILLDYSVGGEKSFIPYFRDLDFGEKTTIHDWNNQIDQFIDNK